MNDKNIVFNENELFPKYTTFNAVDFETATHDRFICQVGIVCVKDGQITERISMLIQPPGNYYDPMTISIHNITPKDTEMSLTFDQAWNKLRKYFEGKHLIAHNSSFDENALRKNLQYYNLSEDNIFPFICTCQLYRELAFRKNICINVGLKHLCTAFSMPYNNHHNAIFDAECCASFYLNYVNNIEPDYSLIIKEESTCNQMTQKKDELPHISTIMLPENMEAFLQFFNGKRCVITGEFDVEREFIVDYFTSCGAKFTSSVSSKTNYVIIGEYPGFTKLKKVEENVQAGRPTKKIYISDLQDIINDKITMKELDLFENNINPFSGVRVYLSGNFSQNKKIIAKHLQQLGASVMSVDSSNYFGLSKETCVVISSGKLLEQEEMKLATLEHDGYHIPVITDTDMENIINGNKDASFPIPVKNVNITYDFIFDTHIPMIQHFNFYELFHPLSQKEIFFHDIKGKKDLLLQSLGNIGSYSNFDFDPKTIDFCWLKSDTIDKLKRGEKDEFIRIITDKYNSSDSTKFTYKFIIESEAIYWMLYRAKTCGDNISLDYLNRYLDSIY